MSTDSRRLLRRTTWHVLFLFVALALAGAAGQGPPETAAASVEAPIAPCVPPEGFAPEWRPIFKGVDCAEAHLAAPPLAAFAVRVDLKAPGIEFLVTPSNGDKPRETDGRKVSAFLEENKLQVAINASPFGPVDDIENGPRSIIGVSISRGDAYSAPSKEYAAMLIGRDNRVWFAEPPVDTAGAYNGVGGFRMLLERGENVGGPSERHPRSVAGVSQDGRYLYLMVVDGRQRDYSVGAAEPETAAWARVLGAFDALNLDGGGSVTLVIDDGNGGARILNQPIHNNLPGNERINGNNLGVFAQPLDLPAAAP